MGSQKKKSPLHSVNYVVELFVDDQDEVQRTKVHHVQSREEESWEGWAGTRLLDFFAGRPELSLGGSEPPPLPVACEPDITPPPLPEAPSIPASEPVSRYAVVTTGGIEIQPGGPAGPLRGDQKYHLRVRLALGDYPAQGALHYTATVFAQGVGRRRHLTVADAEGIVSAAPEIQLDLDGAPLPAGIYRTYAAIMLTPRSSPQTPARAMLEGGLLQVT